MGNNDDPKGIENSRPTVAQRGTGTAPREKAKKTPGGEWSELPGVEFEKKAGDIYRSKDGHVILLLSNMKIDADGAPNAYHPDSKSGLDLLTNAGHNKNWWAIVTDNDKKDGNPVIKTDGQYKGFYISKTAFEDNHIKDNKNQAKYVDATKIAYAVLRPDLKKYHVSLGDLGYAHNIENGMSSAFIVGDAKNKNNSEGSIRLAQKLGLVSDPRSKSAGTDKKIIQYFFFPNSNKKFIRSEEELERTVKQLLFYYNWYNTYKN